MRPIERANGDRVLGAIGSGRLSGHEILSRLANAPTADPPERPAKPSEPLLYPTLHRLEANGRLKATWSLDAAGRARRVYWQTRRGRSRP